MRISFWKFACCWASLTTAIASGQALPFRWATVCDGLFDVAGTVTDETGNPIHAGHVQVFAVRAGNVETISGQLEEIVAISDADGGFRIRVPRHSRGRRIDAVAVKLSHADYVSSVARISLPQDSPAFLRLRRPTALTGTTLLAGRKISGARILGVSDQVFSDLDGQFKFVVRDGFGTLDRFLVWAEYCDKDGVVYTSEMIAGQVESVPTTPITLELKRAPILRGRLIASDGSQFRKSTVYGYLSSGNAFQPLPPLEVNKAEFELENLPYGRLHVWVDSDTHSSQLYMGRGSTVGVIDITEPDPEKMDFVLQRKAHVRVRTRTSDGCPVAGASLGLFSPNVFLSNGMSLLAPGVPMEVTSDAQGRFSVFVPPYGMADLQVHCHGYDFGGAHGEHRFRIELSPGSVHDLDVVGRKVLPERE